MRMRVIEGIAHILTCAIRSSTVNDTEQACRMPATGKRPTTKQSKAGLVAYTLQGPKTIMDGIKH